MASLESYFVFAEKRSGEKLKNMDFSICLILTPAMGCTLQE